MRVLIVNSFHRVFLFPGESNNCKYSDMGRGEMRKALGSVSGVSVAHKQPGRPKKTWRKDVVEDFAAPDVN